MTERMSLACSPHFDENSLKSAQRASLNLHSVACLQKRPRLIRKPGRDDGLYRIDLGFVH